MHIRSASYLLSSRVKQLCRTSAFHRFFSLLCWQGNGDNSNSLLFHCVFNSSFISRELNKAFLTYCQELKQTRCAGPDGEVQFEPILIESIISVQLGHDRMPLYLLITVPALNARDTVWCIFTDGLRLRLEDRKTGASVHSVWPLHLRLSNLCCFQGFFSVSSSCLRIVVTIDCTLEGNVSDKVG